MVNVSSEECNLFVECYPSNPLPHLHPFHFEIKDCGTRLMQGLPPFPNWWTYASIFVYIISQKCCPSCFIVSYRCVPLPAALVYILLCVVMLVLQPQMSIEPVGMSRQLHSLEEGREGRGRRVGGYEGLGRSHMGTLLRSHMFTEQGIKLKWIGERIKR